MSQERSREKCLNVLDGYLKERGYMEEQILDGMTILKLVVKI
jgi:hypothetical protein